MKKFLLALLALPMLLAATSCSDDDSLPQVNINLTYGNAVVVDNRVYVVKNDTLRVESVNVTAVREGHKATNGSVSYFIDGVPVGTNPFAPYGIAIATDSFEPGAYVLQLVMPIYEEGCELSTALSQVSVNVVASQADIPSSATPSNSQQIDYKFQ